MKTTFKATTGGRVVLSFNVAQFPSATSFRWGIKALLSDPVALKAAACTNGSPGEKLGIVEASDNDLDTGLYSVILEAIYSDGQVEPFADFTLLIEKRQLPTP